LLSTDLNNARLALIDSYQGGVCAFDKLYRSAGGDFVIFHRMAAEKGKLGKARRSSFLDQECEVIASSDDL
jgi:predicted aminopeptidase